MPGCGLNLLFSCSVRPAPTKLVVLPTGSTSATADDVCPIMKSPKTLQTGATLEERAVAIVDLSNSDTYAVPLDAGTYDLAFVDATGCGACNSVESPAPNCPAVTVGTGEVVRFDVIQDQAAE